LNPDLARLQPYPFERLAALFAGVEPPSGQQLHRLSVGEPQHAPPQFVLETLRDNLPQLARYPTTRGGEQLRRAQAAWLQSRHGLREVDHDSEVLPVNGTAVSRTGS
jgi:N-succinyldiaminopimelate aminotransferase